MFIQIPFIHKHFGTNVDYSKLTQSASKCSHHLIKGKYAGYEVVNYFETTKLTCRYMRFVNCRLQVKGFEFFCEPAAMHMASPLVSLT